MKLKYVISIILICSIYSCSLDYEPLGLYSDVTEGESDAEQGIFANKQAVELHRQNLLNLFREGQEHWYLDMLLLTESHSDNAYAGSPSLETTPFEVNSIEASNPNLFRDWNMHMNNIGAVNRMIYGINDVKDLTDAEKNQYIGEAKILRAMVYFDMVRIWGNVPLITYIAPDITGDNVEEVYPLYFPAQTDEVGVYKQIEKDLKEALASPNVQENRPNDKTQITKSVARALLVKIYAEKPLQNYDEVIKYADELAADFALVENFSDLFGVTLSDTDSPPSQTNPAIDVKRNTAESIYEAQFSSADASWATWMFGRKLDDYNFWFDWAKWITPSRDLSKAFLSEAGDKRYAESVVFYQCTWSIYYPADNYAFMYKCRSGLNSIIKIRYADILLLKAEALIAKGNLPEATTIINDIRKRAGLGMLPQYASANKDALLEAYLKERRLELAFEGERWFDLVRLDKVETVLNFIKDEGRPPLVYLFDHYSYKLPIPQRAIDQNPNLVQNPGH